MAVGVIDRLETIQVQVQQGELVSVAARRRHGALQREAQAEAIHQPGQRVAPRQPVAVALGLHGRHQHAIEAVRRHRHAGQVERQLHADDPQAVLAGEPGQGSARPQAHADHQRGQARRAEIAETDAAHHGGGGQAGQDRRDPVAAGHADERAVAHAARPQHGQHDIGVGMGGPAGRGGAARRHQHDGARQAAGQLERQPCDERRLRQGGGGGGGGGGGRRMAMISATSTLLSTPPTKIEIVPNRPPSSAWRMSSGTFRPGSASQRVTGQAGGL
ncbi:Uncharacterised protein [Bordetella pertussis]|nr:Uncharacterised protein [Bordetella pertussis]